MTGFERDSSSVGDTAAADQEFLAFLERFDDLMLQDPAAALEWIDAAPEWIRDDCQWVLCRADALRAAHNANAAVAYLQNILAEAPEFADAHHRLAELKFELGDTRQAILHQLETLRLDSTVDLVAEPASAELTEAIVAAAERTLADLPSELQARMAHVPVLLQPRPSPSLVAEGFDARALGLFEGPNLIESSTCDSIASPTSITLYVNCLFDAFGDDEGELLEQVRVTVLHEVGHYFGLNEQQLAELGLE